MHVLSFTGLAILLFIAMHYHALSEELTGPQDFVDLEGLDDLFSTVIDLPSIDNAAAPNDQTWASLLQPINEYTSGNVIYSSPRPSDSLLSYEPSPCLGMGEDTSASLFGRSDDWNIDEDYTAVQPAFCFQNPDEQPLLPIIPNLLDLPPPDMKPDPEKFPVPSLVFPRRPVCPHSFDYYRLCCNPGGKRKLVKDCVTCTLHCFPINPP